MRPPSLTSQDLERTLRQRGAAPARDLAQAHGVSQPTVWRALRALQQTGKALAVGATSNQIYVAHEPRPRVHSPVDIAQVDGHGALAPFGQLIPTTDGRYWFSPIRGAGGMHGGLPWFVSDMRLQGFMGRAFARENVDLGLPQDIQRWSDDHVLIALTAAGHDLPGNLIVGDAAINCYLGRQRAALPTRVESEQSYPALADSAINGESGGSSAGGEQPKFCVLRGEHHRIVKFSSAAVNDVAQRQRDLLMCEHLANQVLDGALGLRVARSQVFHVGGRAFLDVERFDRTAHGRIGMVSLLAFDSEYIGSLDNWAATALRMQQRGLMDPDDARRLQLLEAFGQLIGNTDRHYGNVSFLREGGRWCLAPVYDMLPMAYYPVNNELPARGFSPVTQVATSATYAVWGLASRLAGDFWARVAQHPQVSPAFRAIASAHAQGLARAVGVGP